jgi:acetylornithine deacetylase
MPFTKCEQVLIDMLRIPSESGRERVLLRWVSSRLNRRFETWEIAVSKNRYDLLFVSGTPKVLLVAHVDTVVGQLDVDIDENNIYGRGSCDNKGSAAAMICAVERAHEQRFENYGLLLTVGEEVNCDGAAAAIRHLDEKGIHPELVVIGEPTGLKVVTAQKGVLAANIRCPGTRAHSSLSERDSATEKLVRVLHELQLRCPDDTYFNIGELSGGEAFNVVAGQAEAKVSWRTSQPDYRLQVLQTMKDVAPDCQAEFVLDMPPVDRTTKRFRRREAAFFSELYFFENSILLGPGDIKNAHTDHEFVPRTELKEAVERYYDLLARNRSIL